MRLKFLLAIFLTSVTCSLFAAAPAITSFSPAKGAVGTVVTITGTDLGGLTAFTIGGANAIVVSDNGTKLVGMVMPGAVTGAVSLTTADGSVHSATNFTLSATVLPDTQLTQKLSISTNQQYAEQGLSVAISADGHTAMVGSNNLGVAVYGLSNGVWTQQGAQLAQPGISFGASGLSLSADGNTALISARGGDNNRGAAFIYKRDNNGTWAQETILTTPSDATLYYGSVYFGSAVSLSADGSTAVVGGYADNNATGAVWVFKSNNGNWTETGKLSPADPSVNYGNGNVYFGWSIMISADASTIAVGGYGDNYYLGAVWIFNYSSGVWSQQGSKLVPSDFTPQNNGYNSNDVGYSVSLSADGNTVSTGGPADNGGLGASWVFARANGNWTQQGTKINPNDGTNSQDFGYSTGLSADGNTLFAAAPVDNGLIGAVWSFKNTNGNWAQQGTKLAPAAANGANLYVGFCLSVTGDGGTLLTGAPIDDSYNGSAYVFSGASAPVVPLITSATASPLPGLTTYQGTASAIKSFVVSGTNMTDVILATPPTGFELSTDSAAFSPTVTVGAAGTIADTKIYYRLSASALGGNYTGGIVLSSAGAANDTLKTAAINTVIPPPAITAFAPNYPAAGDTIKVKGLNFAGATAITFGGLAPASYTISGDTLIVAVINGTTSGTIDIVSPAGTGSVGGYYGNNKPHITYNTPLTYAAGTVITPLTPANNGGAVGYSNPGYVSTIAGHGWAGTEDGPGLSANFNGPFGTAADGYGNVYIADTHNNSIRKIDAYGNVSTFAGSYASGTADGQGTAARFSAPVGVAVDSHGNVYVTDRGNNSIRKISASGYVTTLASTGFAAPYGIAVDKLDNVYVTDHDNNEIKKIDAAGIVTVLAGSTTQGKADGNGSAASFFNPSGIAIDQYGVIYVSDQSNNLIRKITENGDVTTFAGSGVIGKADGKGITASFAYPCGIAVDLTGNLYVADGWSNNLIREILPDGTVTTLAGNGTSTSTDGLGAVAGFNFPYGISTDKNGYLYVGESGGYLIRKIGSSMAYGISPALPAGLSFDQTTGIISGTPAAGSLATDYTVTGYNASGSSSFKVNINITAAPVIPVPTITSVSPATANIGDQITITGTNFTGVPTVIINGTAATNVVLVSATSITANIGTGTQVGADSVVVNTTAPIGKAIYKNITITTPGAPPIVIIFPAPPAANPPVIAYTGPNTYNAGTAITPLTPSNTGGTVGSGTPAGTATTLAGAGYAAMVNANGTSAVFNGVYATAVDANGNVYVADTYNNMIRKITPAGDVTTFAGSGTAGAADGQGTAASFSRPVSVAVDASGNVFVADQSNNAIRKIDANGNVTTIGTGFSAPAGVATDAAGNVYFTDKGNNQVKKITPTGTVSTIAGSGQAGNTDGSATAASFNNPYGITVDQNGVVYVSDQSNNLIRKITGGVVSTLAGSGAYGAADGQGTAASFGYPCGLATDIAGNIYVADGWSNNVIRKITSTGTVTTLPGTYKNPYGLSVDKKGNLYIAETGGYVITKVGGSVAYSISPALPTGLTFDTNTGIISGTPTAGSGTTTYTITAYNADGSSTTTVDITVNIPLTFAAIAPVTYGAADFAPGAMSSFPITYGSSDATAATIVAGQIHIIGAGTTTITATDGNGATVTQTLTIGKKVLTVTANPKTMTAGGTVPNLTVSYSDFAYNDTQTNSLTSLPVAATTASGSSVAGTYAITVSGGAAANYSFSFVQGTLTILEAPAGLFQPSRTALASGAPHVNPAVSPNGDGHNDILTIKNIANFPSNRLQILDANGFKIFDQWGYNNVNNVFDGHSNIYSWMEPKGTYMYVLEYTDGGTQKYETGYIVLKY